MCVLCAAGGGGGINLFWKPLSSSDFDLACIMYAKQDPPNKDLKQSIMTSQKYIAGMK